MRRWGWDNGRERPLARNRKSTWGYLRTTKRKGEEGSVSKNFGGDKKEKRHPACPWHAPFSEVDSKNGQQSVMKGANLADGRGR